MGTLQVSQLSPKLRDACVADLSALVTLEHASFETDRISKRSFTHYIQSQKCLLIVAELQSRVVAYGLVLLRKGTRLARLYSLAVDASGRGMGIGRQLLLDLEFRAREKGKLFMRLEVASNNRSAIRLYEQAGYSPFGIYKSYYENDIDAIRMQKTLRRDIQGESSLVFPWYQQSTDFTCGPASLLMAMNYLDPNFEMNQAKELDIWRQATTIFMTAGHGGCHPLGLAIAAHQFGFHSEVLVNTSQPLFLDGVRSEHKKQIIKAVDRRFQEIADELGVRVSIVEPHVAVLRHHLASGGAVICLISTYQMDSKKTPHWVVITGIDEQCLYFHDPDQSVDSQPGEHQDDAQHVPLALDDFAKMSAYGKNKLRTVVVLYKNNSMAETEETHD